MGWLPPGLVHIFDRHGEQIEEVPLSSGGKCIALDWDKDGEVLAILQENNSQVPLWDLVTHGVTYLETNLKDPTFLKWSKVGPQLAIGTAKGNLLLYRKDNRKKIPILGKHTKKVVCGAWSANNTLALGGEDNMLTLSNADGETIEMNELKYTPVEIQFAMQKTDTGGHRGSESKGADPSENTVSINMGGRTVLLYNVDDPDNPVELAFQGRYGNIVTYRWFGDGYMMIGFSEGFVVVISTHMREIGEELFSGQFHKGSLDDIACSPVMQRAATAGGNVIKIIDMSEWKEIKSDAAVVERRHGPIEKLGWTSDGQILTATTRSGTVYNFLARMPTIHDSNEARVAYLSSLREISVLDTLGDAAPLTIPISIEPSFVALGSMHCAVGMNNRVWYYRCDSSSQELVNEREYLSTVDQVQLNRDYAAVLCEGRVYLQAIEMSGGERETKVFPDRDDAPQITCMSMTTDFLVYGTDAGTIEFFYVSDWTSLSASEHRHEVGIKSVFPNPAGTRVIFLDTEGAGFLYNPVNGLVLPIPKLQKSTNQIMWDSADWGVFLTSDAAEFNTYIHSPLTINGPQIVQLGSLEIQHNGDMIMEPRPTRVPHGSVPILVYDGVVTCQQQNGSLGSLTLATHDKLGSGRMSGDQLRSAFSQNLALLRLNAAWELASSLKSKSFWLALSGKAMEQLNIEMAIRVYRELGDAGMVMALEQINDVEDKNLLAGHVAMLFADYDQAQELFLTSTRPITALEMRRDLLHWDHALKLAQTLAADQVPELSVEYAKQQEFKGEYSQALSMYQSAESGIDSRSERGAALLADCHAGVARMTLRLGDIRRGLAMCTEIGDKNLCRMGAAILESMKQFADAANLYIKADEYDKAAAILIHSKNWSAVAPLMEEKVTQPKLHAQYAKAKEMEKDYAEAARAYERARDMDSVVRLLLDHLNQPGAASDIVRRTQSSDGAQMVAKFLRNAGDNRGAIEFLLLAKRSDDAFELAKSHDEMDVYADRLGKSGSDEEYLRIARYFESKSKWGRAGEFFAICGQYHKALKLFLQCGEAEMEKAIEVVGKARSDMLTHTLIDFLMGETDGVPKDPNYIFRLYMALGNYPQAGKTAIIISRQEQELGNYKVAHSILFETHKDLEGQNIRVPQALSRSLRLLHSYILVKKLVKQNNHEAAARMLIRVAKHISKFPSHIVPILTSTVIECQRAGLKRSAFEYASMLMRQEYRRQIEPKLKRKIEQLVRRPNTDEAEEDAQPCPFCAVPLSATTLECTKCMNTVPYCIVTGRHMNLDDWSFCPNCKFPALYTALGAYLAFDSTCPMCDTAVTASITKLSPEDAKTALQRFKAGPDEEEDDEETGDGDADGSTGGAGGAAPSKPRQLAPAPSEGESKR